MSTNDIIRAWRDEEYRESLSQEERAQLLEHPAGVITVANYDLAGVTGSNHMAEAVSVTGFSTTVCSIYSNGPICCC